MASAIMDNPPTPVTDLSMMGCNIRKSDWSGEMWVVHALSRRNGDESKERFVWREESGSGSSKPILFHPSNPWMFLIGKLMGYMLKYYKNNNLFLVCVISTRGRQKRQKCMANAHFGVCLHIFTSSFHPSQTMSPLFGTTQNSILSASWYYKSVLCALFHYKRL